MRYKGLVLIGVAAAAAFAAVVAFRQPAVERAVIKSPAVSTPPAPEAAPATSRAAPPTPPTPPPAAPAPPPEVRQAAVRRHADGMARILRQAVESGDVDQRNNAVKALKRMGAEGVAAVRGELQRAAKPDVQEALRGALAELK